ncbi:mpv17-like protein 2 [Uloborus diversus]|uniref:mpv17-like protein 2 n=1 Tax=Uloborus diversus TaxID=327109 RepID=UPI00240A6C09|nr:mpv17-like protein 2 [Uloborus diversus]XP_054714035.1 mpv17-like protein 2 [Uloborus diversus]XP_054714036.1 mpv17-like protein 2 [Uloborus diversus]
MATMMNVYLKKVFQKTVLINNHLFKKHLLLTNATFSMAMGIAGDLVQQHYEILTKGEDKWKPVRTFHMSAAGLTTGVLSHYWYIIIDLFIPGSSFRAVVKKVLYDQILFSPVNLTVYFGTVAVLEGSLKQLKEELIEKGTKIYTAEWIIWPPAQFINFYILPLRYRVFFDNFISFGFDIYSPYVKYKCKLKSEINDES